MSKLRMLFLLLALSVAPATLADGIPISGRVLVDGVGAVGASVSIHAQETRWLGRETWHQGEANPPALAKVQTQKDGSFEVTAPSEFARKVRVELDGYLPVEYIAWPWLEKVTLPTVELELAREANVVLTSSDGKTIRDAKLMVGQASSNSRFFGGRSSRIRGFANRWSVAVRVGVSDDRGQVRLPVGNDETLAIEAVAPGLPPMADQMDAKRKMALRFAPGQAHALQALDAGREPVANALVFAKGWRLPVGQTDEHGEVLLGVAGEQPLDLTLVDGSGRYGRLVLKQATPDSKGGSTEARPSEGISSKDIPTEVIQLDAPKVLTGRVIDLATRQPIAGARVSGSDLYGDRQATDAQGAYQLIFVGENVSVSAVAVGHLPGADRWSERTGNSQVPTLALLPSALLRGEVLDKAGNPLAGVEVAAVQQEANSRFFLRGGSSQSRNLATQTGGNGRFQFTSLAANSSYQLFFKRQGLASKTLGVEGLKAEEPRSVKVVMQPGLQAMGWVVDGEEKAVRGAEIEFVRAEPQQQRGMAQFFGDISAGSEPEEILSDEEGQFTLSDLTVGTYDLRVSARGFAPATVRGIEIATLPEGQPQDEVFDLGVLRLTAGAKISGRVVDGDDRPIPQAKIYWESSQGGLSLMFMGPDEEPAAVSDSDGFFVVPDLLPESICSISVSHPNYLIEILSGINTSSKEELRAVLKPASRVSGLVLNEKGQPIAGARVRFSAEGRGGSSPRGSFVPGGEAMTSSDLEGRFVIDGIKPGSASLSASANGYQPMRLSSQQVPEAGELRDVRLTLQPGATIQGTVRAADGTPLVGAQVHVTESGGGRGGILEIAMTDGDGSYRALGISPGPRVIKAIYQDLQQAAVEAEIELGTNTVDLTIQKGVDVQGWVVDETGKPVEGVSIQLGTESSFWRQREIVSNQDGNFVIEGVLPGSYNVTFRREGYAKGRLPSPLVVVDQPLQGVELRLLKGASLNGRILGLEFDEIAQVQVTATNRDSYLRGTVDFEGSYRIENLSPGAWIVLGQLQSQGRQTQVRLEVEAGVLEVEQDLVFGGGYTLAGTFLIDDEPMPGASVRTWHMESGQGGVATTDSRGAFRIEGIEEGTHRVSIYDLRSGMSLGRQVEIQGDEEIAFHLVTGALTGKVKDQLDGGPLAGVRLLLSQVETGAASEARHSFRRSGESDSVGSFNLGRVPEGRWKVRTQHSGYAAEEVEVDVVAGQEINDLEILLQPTEGIVFEVISPSGFPAREVWAAVLDSSGKTVARGSYTVTDGGRVRISNVPAGSFELLITSEGAAVAQRLVSSPGRSDAIRLEAGGRLELIFPELAEQSISASVTLTRSEGLVHRQLSYGSPQTEFAVRHGRVQLEQLAGGLYEVKAELKGGRILTGFAEVIPGVMNVVEIP